MPSKPIVLFLCTRNSARSQMAEGLMRRVAGDRYEVHSAGLVPGELHPLAVKAMAEIGIDISRQRAKAAGPLLGRLPAVFLIVVCGGEDAPTAWPNILSRDIWPLPDPVGAEGTAEERVAAFRRVRDELEGRIEEWVARRDLRR